MRKRDLEIIKSLEKFRCLSRDDIIDFHFFDKARPENSANSVLLRLLRDGYVKVNKEVRPYVYFPNPSAIKLDSVKMKHYLKIAYTCRQILKHFPIREFVVEPKLGPKGMVEPDALVKLKEKNIFLEIQRSYYSNKMMNDKIKRYESYYRSEQWKNDFGEFPEIVMVTDVQYRIFSDVIRPIQVEDIEFYLKKIKKAV